jgi:hypothetical protein
MESESPEDVQSRVEGLLAPNSPPDLHDPAPSSTRMFTVTKLSSSPLARAPPAHVVTVSGRPTGGSPSLWTM